MVLWSSNHELPLLVFISNNFITTLHCPVNKGVMKSETHSTDWLQCTHSEQRKTVAFIHKLGFSYMRGSKASYLQAACVQNGAQHHRQHPLDDHPPPFSISDSIGYYREHVWLTKIIPIEDLLYLSRIWMLTQVDQGCYSARAWMLGRDWLCVLNLFP